LYPQVRIGFVTSSFAAEISLCVIGSCDQFGIAVCDCIHAYVAGTADRCDEDENAKDVSTPSVSKWTVLNRGIDFVIVTFVVGISETLALLSHRLTGSHL
jgi:hypothetical protein